MKWIDLAKEKPKQKGEYVVRSKETGAKHVLVFNEKNQYFYKIGNGFQATLFEWLDETESKGIEAIANELENLNPFNRPEYNEMYSAGYSNAVARLRELIKQKGGQL